MNPDFYDMLSAFTAEGVEYLLVGAQALAVHGVPRATGDLDLWVRATPENASRVLAALRRFGAPLDQVSAADFASEDVVFQIGVAPHRIDLVTSIEGIEFKDAVTRRTTTVIQDLQIPVLGRDDFIANKRAVGRPKDLADIASLEEQS
ncbi:MAG: hypothetical protein IID41_13045 [Planctomycetes bacterium]|nr:hypothetical protein [Planctomycetota bacterium]